MGYRINENPDQVGWKVREWAANTSLSRATVYELIAQKRIDSVKFRAARIITTPPLTFLNRWGGECSVTAVMRAVAGD